MRIDKRRLYHLDWYLIINVAALIVIGLVNLISATRSIESGPYSLLVKQLVALVLGFIVIVIVCSYDYRLTASYSRQFYLVGLCLILVVLIIGSIAGGAKRWLMLGGVAFQPSELMKPLMVLFLAHMLQQKKVEGEPLGLKQLVVPLLYIVVPCVLILKQPDLGTAVVILLTCLCMLWFVGMKWSAYAFLAGIGTVAIPIFWKYLMKPYQKMRILSLISPELDPSGYGYHSIQAKIAVGSGKFFGKGYLAGTQHKLHFIPEHHTDFIFTVFGEEWGFIGSVVLFLLFLSLIYRCLKISMSTADMLGSTIAFGIASIIFVQFTVNILMAINLAPVVGIPLPFISYGGSSLITSLICIGLLLNVNMRRYMF